MFFSSFDANYRSGMTVRKFNGNDRTALSCFSKGFLKLVCVLVCVRPSFLVTGTHDAVRRFYSILLYLTQTL